MADFSLRTMPPLGGYERDFNGTELRELVNLAIVVVSIPNDEGAIFAQALLAGYGAEMPDHGNSVLAKEGKTRIIRFARDQVMVLFDHETPDAPGVVSKAMNGVGYAVDQTHNWVTLALSGPLARAALERICAVNLHKDAFARNLAERTALEKMGAIVIRTGEDEFLLMSGVSSAKSFLHAVETSINNVL